MPLCGGDIDVEEGLEYFEDKNGYNSGKCFTYTRFHHAGQAFLREADKQAFTLREALQWLLKSL